MTLYLLRHGEAALYAEHGDRSRVLTENGIEQSRVAGRYLKDIHPDVVLISTFVRAKQTLEIVNFEGGSCTLREFVCLDLAPSGSIEDLLIEIVTYHAKSILLVGHNPQLSNLIYHITGEEKNMGNCSFAEIDLDTKKLISFTSIEDMKCTN